MVPSTTELRTAKELLNEEIKAALRVYFDTTSKTAVDSETRREMTGLQAASYASVLEQLLSTVYAKIFAIEDTISARKAVMNLVEYRQRGMLKDMLTTLHKRLLRVAGAGPGIIMDDATFASKAFVTDAEYRLITQSHRVTISVIPRLYFPLARLTAAYEHGAITEEKLAELVFSATGLDSVMEFDPASVREKRAREEADLEAGPAPKKPKKLSG